MLISVLKHIKLLRHISILTDHRQEVCLYLVKVTEVKIHKKSIKIIPGVVAAERVVSIPGDPCGTVC